jgi:DNA-binding NarL/FixJ family response regulator
MIRVLIVADVRLYREGLAEFLGREPHLEVTGAVRHQMEAVDRIPEARPDVVVFHVAAGDGVAALRAVTAAAPGVRVVVLAVPEAEGSFLAYAEAGMAGCLTLEASLADLVAAIEGVMRRELVCTPRMAAMLLQRVSTLVAERPAPSTQPRLTTRELEIVGLLDRGLSNKEIARRLCIEVSTVKNHVHSILEKLGVPRRADAAAWARHAFSR